MPFTAVLPPQEQTISDKFAGLSEALQVAESKAREATEMRKQVALEMARRQKMAKDDQLRKLAQQARMERGGPLAAAAGLAGRDTAAVGAAAGPAAGGGGYPGPPPGMPSGGGGRDASPSSSSEDERRRGHGGSRRDGRLDDYDERGRRGRDEYEETAQVWTLGQGGAGGLLSCLGSLDMVLAWSPIYAVGARAVKFEMKVSQQQNYTEVRVYQGCWVERQSVPCSSRVWVLYPSCGLLSTTHQHNDSQLFGAAARGVMWPLTCCVLPCCAVPPLACCHRRSVRSAASVTRSVLSGVVSVSASGGWRHVTDTGPARSPNSHATGEGAGRGQCSADKHTLRVEMRSGRVELEQQSWQQSAAACAGGAPVGWLLRPSSSPCICSLAAPCSHVVGL